MEDHLYTRVLNYLTIRPRSEKEIREYIARQLAKPKVAKLIAEDFTTLTEKIISRLKAQRFLDDFAFAQWWVRSRLSYKKKGRGFITRELFQKGIKKEMVELVFQSPDEELPTDLENAVSLLEKKRKKYELLERRERFNKAGQMLARYGFDLDTIKRAIDSVFGK